MKDLKLHIIRIESGIEASKTAAKQLLEVLKRDIETPEDKIKIAVDTKKLTALDYFFILKTIKSQTDNLIILLEAEDRENVKKNWSKQIRELKYLFDYLKEAYADGIEAIDKGLDDLLLALEKSIDSEKKLTSDKLKSISTSKKIASEDYFFLLNFKNVKSEEIKSLNAIVRPEESVEEIPELETKTVGYAEQYAS